MKSEIEQILNQTDIIATNMKITRQEALLLIIAQQLVCLHDHIDKVIYGIIGAHAPRKPQKDKKD